MSRVWGGILYAYRNYLWNNDNLSPLEKLLFFFFCDNQDYCSKSIETISKSTGMNRKTVLACIKSLEDKHFIIVQRNFKRPLIIRPNIPKLDISSTKNGTRETTSSTKNGTTLCPKTVLGYAQKRYSNTKRTIKEQYNSDFSNREEGLTEMLQKENVSSLLDLMRKRQCSKNQNE